MTSKYIPALALVSSVLPPVERAYALLQRASDAGFKWPHAKAVLSKVREEWQEVREVMSGSDDEKKSEEIGDLLSASVNLARFLHVPVSELSLEPVAVTVEEAHAMINEALEGFEEHVSVADPTRISRSKNLVRGIASLAVLSGVQPEKCVTAANQKFIERFNHVEDRLRAAGRSMADTSLGEMVAIWNEKKPDSLSRRTL